MSSKKAVSLMCKKMEIIKRIQKRIKQKRIQQKIIEWKIIEWNRIEQNRIEENHNFVVNRQ